jgi:hypothetical protein
MLSVLFFLLNSMQAILERYSKSSDGLQPGNESEVKKKKPLMERLASLVAFSFFFFFAPFQNTANGFENNVLCAECANGT